MAERELALPSWEPRVTAELERAQRAVLLLGRATPTNLGAELERLELAYRYNDADLPRFEYEPSPPSDLEQELQRLADELERIGGPLAELYAARARELALEQALCTAAGSPSFWSRARERYRAAGTFGREADLLAESWVAETDGTRADDELDETETSVSDDERDPQSLVSRMLRAVGERKLPVRVLVSDRLSALAATGSGVILVAKGRRLRHEDVERTVLHELEGHALPRERGLSRALGLFHIGTAGGSDDQEGRALGLEKTHGFLRGARRVELARRHRACRSVEAGADFGATVRGLTDVETPLGVALRIAARAHRGGGLGREVVYLPSYLKVRAALRAAPHLDEVLGCGRISVEAASALAPWLHLTRVS